MRKVLFIASEGVPFAKSGGLGDVIGSLPKQLNHQDLEVRVIMPKYGTIPERFRHQMEDVIAFSVPVGGQDQYVGLQKLEHEGITFYFIDNEYYFKRPSMYGHYDDGERFAYFNIAVMEAIEHMDFSPDVLHCHDWHAGMIPVLLADRYRWKAKYSNLATVFTIHNLAYQGIFPKSVMTEMLGLNDGYFTNDKLEFFGAVNFMKGGLVYANAITTVSPTYASEIQHGYFGEKLDGLLSSRSHDLKGILNGIDYELYDPATDEHIFTNYNWRATKKRLENKAGLQKMLGLPVREDVPLVALISRLVQPKGMDLLAYVLDEMLHMDIQMVVLGVGEPRYEELFRSAVWRHSEKIATNIGFDDALARKIYAGSDVFLMPSLFEPCGIGQMIALRYGSLPLVRETGGLKDTVIPYNRYTGEGTGFSFSNINAHEMLFALKEAVELYQDRKIWSQLVSQAMKTDCSWTKSAATYQELYGALV